MRISRNTVLLGTVALAAVLATPSYAQEEESAGYLTNLGQIIFGAGAEKVAIDVPQAVTVIDEDEIEKESPDTIGDIVKNVPGVTTVGSESFFGESLNIRGIGAGGSADEPKIVMTIDGVGKYYEQYRMGSMFTDPSFFKRVEVLRGPASSTLYGAGAIAGVVAMETKDASDFIKDPDDTFSFFQKLEYKTNGSGKSSTSVMAFRRLKISSSWRAITIKTAPSLKMATASLFRVPKERWKPLSPRGHTPLAMRWSIRWKPRI